MAEQKKSKRLAKPGLTVELCKGSQWVDDLSGISLYRGLYNMATTAEMKSNKEAAKKGYVKLEDEKKPTAVIPDVDDEDLIRVEKALRLGTLKIYDKNNPTEYVYDRNRDRSQAKFNNDDPRGFNYEDEDTEKIVEFLKLPIDDFKSELKKIKSLATLEKIFENEYAGRNKTAGPRKVYAHAIREQIKAKTTKGLGTIKTEVEESIEIASGNE